MATEVRLVDDELSRAGDRAEVLVAEAREQLTPGGLLTATVRNRVHAAATGADLGGLRGFSADELAELVAHEGFVVEAITAPGVDDPVLLDAAPRITVVARAPRSAADRSRVFFATLPRKIVAAAVLCRDEDGRLLVVFDSYRQVWTLPGGVVHADESPRDAATREAWEEAGVRVRLGDLLEAFPGSQPDRVALVYAAEAVGPIPEDPEPVHTHEIDAVAWWSLDEALERLSPDAAARVRACLSSGAS